MTRRKTRRKIFAGAGRETRLAKNDRAVWLPDAVWPYIPGQRWIAQGESREAENDLCRDKRHKEQVTNLESMLNEKKQTPK